MDNSTTKSSNFKKSKKSKRQKKKSLPTAQMMADWNKGKAVLYIHEFHLIAYKFLEVIYGYFISLLSPEGEMVAKGERNF